ncbi:outer membrane beta-barrel protein [Lysobacter tyrosinilyticus]
MNKKFLLALSLAAALPFTASAADGLSYNYVEGGYSNTHRDRSVDTDGWNLNGSAAISDNFHVFGGYTSEEYDGLPIEMDHWRAGLGYNRPIAGNTDLLARVAYENDKVEAGSFTDRRDGYSTEVGVRSALAPHFEGYALAGYEDGEHADGDFYGRVGAQVKFNQNWGLTGDVKVSDHDTQYFIGPRLSF